MKRNESLYRRLSALSFALPQLRKDNCIAIVRIMVLFVFYSMGDLEILVIWLEVVTMVYINSRMLIIFEQIQSLTEL